MERPKTYVATIEVTFEVSEKENPRSIAKHIADSHNGMRGANLRVYSELGQVRLVRNLGGRRSVLTRLGWGK